MNTEVVVSMETPAVISEPKLKIGQFKVKMMDNEKEVDVIVNRLTPEEMADGWQQVLPHRKNKDDFYHFSVFLSQLPNHLFPRLRMIPDAKAESGERWKTINDQIYQYSVKTTPHDAMILRLQKILQDSCHYRSEVEQLYQELTKAGVKGWLMLRAKKLMTEMDEYSVRYH